MNTSHSVLSVINFLLTRVMLRCLFPLNTNVYLYVVSFTFEEIIIITLMNSNEKRGEVMVGRKKKSRRLITMPERESEREMLRENIIVRLGE
jgi:hypothetical protein